MHLACGLVGSTTSVATSGVTQLSEASWIHIARRFIHKQLLSLTKMLLDGMLILHNLDRQPPAVPLEAGKASVPGEDAEIQRVARNLAQLKTYCIVRLILISELKFFMCPESITPGRSPRKAAIRPCTPFEKTPAGSANHRLRAALPMRLLPCVNAGDSGACMHVNVCGSLCARADECQGHTHETEVTVTTH